VTAARWSWLAAVGRLATVAMNLKTRNANRADKYHFGSENLGYPSQAPDRRETRDLAPFDLATESRIRAYDLTKLRVRDIVHRTQESA
jgi:predicted ATP-dependent Lon-type protease